MRTKLHLLLLAAGLLAAPSYAGELNLFEWSAVAPIVVQGEILGEEGKYVALHVNHVLRGNLVPESRVLIDRREANRHRSRNANPKGLKLHAGTVYLLLLEPSENKKGEAKAQVFSLVRGVQGARPLPPEGAGAVLDAVREFVDIQDQRSETITWTRFGRMLEETNPILVDVALEQFIKFHRGDPETLLSVGPLLDHPQEDIRLQAARLIGQVVELHTPDALREEDSVRTGLIAAARRDESPEVRIAAIESLIRFDDLAAVAVLEEAADKDPDQHVRYAAEKLLYERRLRAGSADSRRN